MCDAESGYHGSWPIEQRSHWFSLYRLDGCLCFQDRCIAKTSELEISIFQWLWLWNHTIIRDGSQCSGERHIFLIHLHRIWWFEVGFFKYQAYLFRDYWEDIGTIKSFFDANLALTQQVFFQSFVFYLNWLYGRCAKLHPLINSRIKFHSFPHQWSFVNVLTTQKFQFSTASEVWVLRPEDTFLHLAEILATY